MNPLKQYFRRPAIYLKLPSNGKYYAPGTLDMPANGELPVYPMTAIDELTTKTPDSLFNGTAIVEIIKSCIPAIKDPWAIPSVDLNAILIAIRTASSGNTLNVDSECPKCNEVGTYGLNLSGLLQNLKAGDFTKPLKLGELSITFKPLSYQKVNETNLQQFDVQVQLNTISTLEDEQQRATVTSETMRKLNENLFRIIADSIESISLPNEIVTNKEYILEFVKNTDRATFDEIKTYGVSLREESELKPFRIKCVSCSNEYEQPLSLNASDFFA